MRLNSFYQYCVYICIMLIIFNFAIAFVNTLDAFPTTYEVGYNGTGASDTSFENLTTNTTGSGLQMDDVWLIVVSAFVVGLPLVIATRSTTIIGVYIFSAVFWASYGHTLLVVHSMLTGYGDFILIGTVAMTFLWVGAVAGMLSGSG